ncbi:hypothetical protein IMM1_31570 [Pseudocoprococcus immobilis]
MYKKRLKTGTVVLAWIYDNDEYTGISIGVSDKETNNPAIAHFESIQKSDGFENRILIRKEIAEQYGFKIEIE